MKTRVNCVEVIINSSTLEVSYRVALPIKKEHIHLLPQEYIQTYARNNKVRYQFVYESKDRILILKMLTSAQAIICQQKILELQIRQEMLTDRIAELYK